MGSRALVRGCAFTLSFLVASTAFATTGLDSPSNGAEQMGRGSAWVARADEPLAVYDNPAALVTQATGVQLGAHMMFLHQCFTRLAPNGQSVEPGGSLPAPSGETCNSAKPFFNPQVAVSYRVIDPLAIGVALVGPHAVGNYDWPESIPVTNRFGASTTEPAPQRYLVTGGSGLLIFPTISASYAVTDTIAIGAGFVWGIASFEFTNFAETTSQQLPGVPPNDDFKNHLDVKAKLTAKDLFVPGFVIGGLWQATSRFDIGAWYKWQDAIRASTDLYVQAKYWTDSGQKSPTDGPVTDVKDAGTLKLQIPMEARLGVRYHHPRSAMPDAAPAPKPRWASGPTRVRDPMSDDLFDTELDVTWANNSSVDAIEVRLRGDPTVGGKPIQIAGTPGVAPGNADIPHNWRDVVGVRLGGDFVVLPSLLALRAGGFFESKGQDDASLNLDFDVAQRFGLSGGATVRVGPVDVTAAYQHTFYGTLDNGGKGGLRGLSGDATSGFRTLQTVNGGKLTSSLNEVALSGTLRL